MKVIYPSTAAAAAGTRAGVRILRITVGGIGIAILGGLQWVAGHAAHPLS